MRLALADVLAISGLKLVQVPERLSRGSRSASPSPPAIAMRRPPAAAPARPARREALVPAGEIAAHVKFAGPCPAFLSTLLVVALLGGTAAAFAVTQGLKTRAEPDHARRGSRRSSRPTCDCGHARRRDPLQAAQARPRPARDRRRRAGRSCGRSSPAGGSGAGRSPTRGTAATTRAASSREGVYKPRVHLADQHRTIDLPNEMQVDTTAPRISIVVAGAADDLAERRRPQRPIRDRLQDRASRRTRSCSWTGKRVVFTRAAARSARRSTGTARSTGRRCGPGVHRAVGSPPKTAPGTPSDTARPSMSSSATSSSPVTAIQAKAGTRFGVRVSADATRALAARRAPGNGGARPARPPRAREAGAIPLVVSVPAATPTRAARDREHGGDGRPRPRGRPDRLPPGSRSCSSRRAATCGSPDSARWLVGCAFLAALPRPRAGTRRSTRRPSSSARSARSRSPRSSAAGRG